MEEYPLKRAKKALKPRKKYDFSKMNRFDYFEFAPSDMNRVKSAAYGYGFRHGLKFSIHTEGDRAFCQRVA